MLKISVLTPSYNSGKYIERAIQSVIRQRYPNVEHIVVDGGSTDETLSLLKKYDYLTWTSEPDKGQSDAMNKAFKASTGDIIVYLNADDEFASGAFNEIVKQFEQHPRADMIVGNLVFAEDKGSSIKSPSANYNDLLLYWRNLHPYNPVSYFYKREVQTAIGDFPLDNHYAMDIWFLLQAYQKFRVIKTNYVLGTFYFDGLNKTATTDVGENLHKAVKYHLKHHDLLKTPYFYAMLLLGKLSRKS